MKISYGPQVRAKRAAAELRAEKRRRWHLWFAWFPVVVDDYDYRWWEVVKRRRCVEKTRRPGRMPHTDYIHHRYYWEYS